MEIGKLTESDLVPLSKLFEQFWNEESSLEKMRTTYRKLKNNPAYILLTAKQEGKLIGFAMGIICEELYGECTPFMVIEDLVVDEEHRRNGAGSSLMRELEKHAHGFKCCQIIFVTESDRTNAHKFYQTLGYSFEPYKGFKKRIIVGQQDVVADHIGGAVLGY